MIYDLESSAMSYDRVDWHHGSRDFPTDVPPENGGTHIGMFLAWAIINGLEGDEHLADCPASLAAVRARQMTGREFLLRECDQKFCDLDLNDEGNAFAKHYYTSPEWRYLRDYDRVFADGLLSICHVDDTWDNYDRMAAVISQRFRDWKRSC
jgi:hypothetical protein